MEATKKQLSEARTAFDAGNFAEAEKVLKSMPREDVKAQHNLVITRYLQHQLTSEQAIAALRANTEGPGENPNLKAEELLLQYEGHETAIYNQAALYARSGQPHEALRLLQRILKNVKDVALPTLAHSLCLYQALSKHNPKSSSRASSQQDDELVRNALNSSMGRINAVPELMRLVEIAFADSSALHDFFKDADRDPVKHAVYLNNLGVFSLTEEKLNVASLFFAKAEKAAASRPTGQFCLHPIQYNVGLCALLREDYEGALQEFLAVQDAMRSSSLFWVRCAEAAVGCVQQEARIQRRNDYERQQDTFSAMLQSGKVYVNFEFMMLPSATSIPGPASLESTKENTKRTALEQLAATAVQNALFLLVPKNHTLVEVMETFPHDEPMLQYAMLYWVALELSRRNYVVATEAGQQLLVAHEHHPLPPNLHVTLLIYLVEALVHLNDQVQALKVLRRTSLQSLLTRSDNDPMDAAQRSRIDALFVSLTITHILNGSWNQAHSIMESLLRKMYDGADAGVAEFTPERDVMFTYCILEVFLELAQGNQERAAEWMTKITWSF